LENLLQLGFHLFRFFIAIAIHVKLVYNYWNKLICIPIDTSENVKAKVIFALRALLELSCRKKNPTAFVIRATL
jgi:hypothetical protein